MEARAAEKHSISFQHCGLCRGLYGLAVRLGGQVMAVFDSLCCCPIDGSVGRRSLDSYR